MGLREIILLAIVVLAIYVAWQLYRVSRMTPKAAAGGSAPPEMDDFAMRTPLADVGSADTGAAGIEDDEALVYGRPLNDRPVANGATTGDVFHQTLEVRQLRRDLDQQRGELDELRAALEELRTIVAGLHVPKAPTDAGLSMRGVSPEYDEALVFARRGLDAEAIAGRCGITLAEAELVRSMARGQTGEDGTTP